MIWIQQEGVEHDAQYRTVALVLLQRLPNIVLQFTVCLPHRCIHRDTQIGFFVGWKLSRDVLQEDEGAQLHQELAEQKRRGPGFRRTTVEVLALEHLLSAGSIFGDGFQNSVVLCERTSSGRAPFVAVFLHPSGFEPEQGVEEIVRVAA